MATREQAMADKASRGTGGGGLKDRDGREYTGSSASFGASKRVGEPTRIGSRDARAQESQIGKASLTARSRELANGLTATPNPDGSTTYSRTQGRAYTPFGGVENAQLAPTGTNPGFAGVLADALVPGAGLLMRAVDFAYDAGLSGTVANPTTRSELRDNERAGPGASLLERVMKPIMPSTPSAPAAPKPVAPIVPGDPENLGDRGRRRQRGPAAPESLLRRALIPV